MREEIQNEAIQTALNYSRCTIVLPVRTGKTKVGLEIANKFKNVLVSYPNNTIKQSWLNDSEKFGFDISNITYTTHLSLHKHNLNSFDLVILDEVDCISEANWMYISSNTPERIVGLTATPPNKGEKLYFLNKFAPIKYKVKLDDTVGKTNKDYTIYVHMLSPSTERNIPLSKGGMWSEANKIAFYEKKYQATKKFFDMLNLMRAIQNSPTKFNKMMELSKKIDRGLIFLETTEQCTNSAYPAYHTKEKNSELHLEQFQNGEINLLSTIGQLRAGVTFPNLNTVIILHCYSSNNKAAQKLGRALNFAEGESANIHILCLKNTRDEQWLKSGLLDFDQNKIKYI